MDYNMTCGSGVQTRSLYCKAGAELEDECSRRSQKPQDRQSCEVSCQGELIGVFLPMFVTKLSRV